MRIMHNVTSILSRWIKLNTDYLFLFQVKEQLASERRNNTPNSTPRITITSTPVASTPDGVKELHISSENNVTQGTRGEPVGSADTPATPVTARSNRSTQSYASGNTFVN